MTKVLFIAYDYPSILSPESIQVQRRAMSLANSGYSVQILTSHKNPCFEYIDNSFLLQWWCENEEIINHINKLLKKIRNNADNTLKKYNTCVRTNGTGCEEILEMDVSV